MKKLIFLFVGVVFMILATIPVSSAKSYSDLTSYQKQKFWQFWVDDCQQLLVDKNYMDYRTCSLNAFEKASIAEESKSWCNDSDGGVDYLKKGVVTTDLKPNGITDYFYTFSSGKTYLFEGACSDGGQYFYYQQSCTEMGAKDGDGVCYYPNQAPALDKIGDKSVSEGEKLEFKVTASDPEGDNLSYSAKNLPAGATFNNKDFSWTPKYNQAGKYEVTFEVDDGKLIANEKITIEVKDYVPEVVWNKNFGGVEQNQFEAIEETSDGGHVLLGYNNQYGEENFYFWVVKVDSNGNEVWNKTYETSFPIGEVNDIEKTSDGGFIFVGNFSINSPNGSNSDIYVIKIDSDGNMKWSKQFGENKPNENDIAKSIAKVSDGGFVIAGYKGYDYYEGLLIKISSDGNKEWEKTFESSLIPPEGKYITREFSTVVETIDGGLAVSGMTGIADQNFWLLKLDKEGILLWEKYYGGDKYERPHSMIQTIDGGYALVGYTQTYGAGKTDAWLLKVDASGQEQWSKTFGGIEGDNGYDVVQTNDGGYLLAASYNTGSGTTGWIIKTDNNGNEEWDYKASGGIGVEWNHSRRISKNVDNSYIIAGAAGTFNPNGNQGWVFKLK